MGENAGSLIAEIRDLYDELAQLSGALVSWDGECPSPAILETRISLAEDRVASIERRLRA